MLLTVTSGIAIALFAPVWFLMDAGIVYSNKKKLEKKRLPPEVRSVGGWYLYLLKGYAGISVLFAFYEMYTGFLAAESGNEFNPGFIILLLIPLLIAILMLPAIVIYDMTSEQRNKYVLKYASKFGIVKNVEVKFEEI